MVEREGRKRAVNQELEYGVPVEMMKAEVGSIAIVVGTFRLGRRWS